MDKIDFNAKERENRYITITFRIFDEDGYELRLIAKTVDVVALGCKSISEVQKKSIEKFFSAKKYEKCTVEAVGWEFTY